MICGFSDIISTDSIAKAGLTSNLIFHGGFGENKRSKLLLKSNQKMLTLLRDLKRNLKSIQNQCVNSA